MNNAGQDKSTMGMERDGGEDEKPDPNIKLTRTRRRQDMSSPRQNSNVTACGTTSGTRASPPTTGGTRQQVKQGAMYFNFKTDQEVIGTMNTSSPRIKENYRPPVSMSHRRRPHVAMIDIKRNRCDHMTDLSANRLPHQYYERVNIKLIESPSGQ